jgi:hypothetical protein
VVGGEVRTAIAVGRQKRFLAEEGGVAMTMGYSMRTLVLFAGRSPVRMKHAGSTSKLKSRLAQYATLTGTDAKRTEGRNAGPEMSVNRWE